MGFCGNCGKSIINTVEYCPLCGHSVGFYGASRAGDVVHLNKADVGKRFGAALIDELVITLILSFFSYGLLGIAYGLLQDSVNGRSLGRLALTQQLIHLKSGKSATFGEALVRNLIAYITYLLVVGLFVDVLLILFRKDGRKIADLIAGTQVIDL